MLIRLAPDVGFDFDDHEVEADGFRAVLCGEAGSGKSHAAASILGQYLLQGERALVLDAHGEYGNLALLAAAPGRSELIGYGDGEPRVEDIHIYLAALEAGASVFVNLLPWVLVDPLKMNRFVFPLLQAVVASQNRNPYRLLLLIEETQHFAPRLRTEGDSHKVWIIKGIATGGRKFGFQTVYCTQRPSLLDATVLAACNVRVFLRTQDREDWDAVRKQIPPRLGITFDDDEESGIRYFQSGEAVVLSRWSPDCRTQLSLPPISPSKRL